MVGITLGLQPCPGLSHGLFLDATGRAHDLSQQATLTAKEASADPRLAGLSPSAVLRLVRTGQLYPVFRHNARVIRIYPAALADWWARQGCR
jgi:hypothetical protein